MRRIRSERPVPTTVRGIDRRASHGRTDGPASRAGPTWSSRYRKEDLVKIRTTGLAAATLAIVLAAGRWTPAVAAPGGEELSQCMMNATTMDDRRSLVRWIFGAAAQNPDVADIASLQSQGSQVLQTSFGMLVEAAMRGLIEHPSVSAALGGVDKELDKQKIGAAAQEGATSGESAVPPGSDGPSKPGTDGPDRKSVV